MSKKKTKSAGTSAPADIDLNNPEFTKAWELLQYTSQSVFLTGKAGTGKSTFLRYITANTRKKYVVLAPTGIAAVNAGGQTIHSFFRLPFHPVMPDDPDFSRDRLRERMKYPSSLIRTLREVELIVIDEISMVRADTIDFIDRLLRFYTRNERQPFGGKQLLLVGDVFQLEPVVTGDMRDILRRHYRHPYFFHAHAFSDIHIVPIELRKVYRQTDDGFVTLLDRIRTGAASAPDIALLNSLCVPGYDASQVGGTPEARGKEFVMTLATRRDMVDHINESRLAAIDRPTVTFTGKITGDFPENSLPTDLVLSLKEGAQIVFIKNDPDHRWVNGTLGRVSAIAKDLLEVTLESGTVITLEPAHWSNIKYSYDPDTKRIKATELGSFRQYPVKLAWALTIHKSQGLTFSNVVIDIGRGAFAGGQTYVALSRCRSLEGMRLLSTVAERDVFVNPAIIEFSRTFNDDRLIEGALEKAHADNCYARAARAASDGNLPEAFDLWMEGMKGFPLYDNAPVMRLARRKLDIVRRQREEIDALKAQLDDDRRRFADIAAEYISLGDDCVADEIYPAAIANFDKALTLLPTSARALAGRARSYAKMERTDQAIADFTTLLSLTPDDIEVHVELAECHYRTGDIHNAMNRCLSAETLRESHACPRQVAVRLHTLLADIYEQLGDTAAATRHRKIAKRLRIL